MATPVTKEDSSQAVSSSAVDGAATPANAESPMPASYVRNLTLPQQSPPLSPGRRRPRPAEGDAILLGLVCCVIS